MNDNDILKYVKHNYEDIKDDILFMANPDNITRSSLTRLFSNRGAKQDPVTKKITIVPAKYKCTDYFDLPANILPNQPEAVKDTTIGIFLFNSFIIAHSFGSKLPYMNETFNDKFMGKLQDELGNFITKNMITVEEYGKFCNTLIWLGYQTELFMPGISLELIIPNEKIIKRKKELLKEHPELDVEGKPITALIAGEYHDKIETPLLDEAKKEMQNNYAGRLYDLKKPSFGNNFKNNTISNGALPDPASGQYKIDINSFNEGINAENFDVLANKTMIGSYNRGVNTQVGGTYAKYVGIMMQSAVTGPKGSDCGTKGYLDFMITKDNMKTVEYNYALINGKEVELTMDLLEKLIGKIIKMRSPIFCKSKQYLCNHCIGNRSYILGIKNLGLTGNIPLDSQKLKSMKSVHDVSIHTVSVDLNTYITEDF
jgi:hypothetical protein